MQTSHSPYWAAVAARLQEFKKDFRANALASLPVTVTAITVSLTIAVISGVPPIAGLLTVVVAGLCNTVCTILWGGPNVTIAGPAAGLAPLVMTAVMHFGGGDLAKGYPQVTAVILIVGACQLVLARFKLARYVVFPLSVERGMFVAIGLSIIVSAIGIFTGNKLHGEHLWQKVSDLPNAINNAQSPVLLIDAICLPVMFGLTYFFMKEWKLTIFGRTIKFGKEWRPIGYVAPLATAAIGWLASFATKLPGKFRVNVPNNVKDSITTPDFKGLFSNSSGLVWVVVFVLAFTLIDTAELLGTCAGIDKEDPQRRSTQTNETLFGAGITNMVSAAVGGITSIQEVLRSRMAILAGAQSIGVNAFMALITLAVVSFGSSFISVLPVAGLTAIVFHVATTLAGRKSWVKTWELGWHQMVVFMAVIAGTVAYDLLVGILLGIAVEILVLISYALVAPGAAHLRKEFGKRRLVKALFLNPLGPSGMDKASGKWVIRLVKPLTFWNMRFLQAAFQSIPHQQGKLDVIIERDDECFVIDPTVIEGVHSFMHYYEEANRGQVHLVALEEMGPVSGHRHAAHISLRPLSPRPPIVVNEETSA